ncbi:MAG: hypothetical protein HY861_02910 [Chlamydiia bacterium]|nr:hypothetical protein [Chlamydiia bacterium]
MSAVPIALPQPNLSAFNADTRSFSFTKLLAITLLAAAAIGLTGALFTNQMFAAIGYALLVVSASVLRMQEIVNDRWLGKVQAAMQRDVALIQSVTKKTEALTQELSKEESRIQETTKTLQGELEKFKGENLKLHNAQHNLEIQIDVLKTENGTLTKTKEGLEATVAHLRQTCAGVQSQVQQFLSLNLKMGQEIGAFQQAAHGLEDTSRELQGAVANMHKTDEEFSSLVAQIALGNKAIQQIVDFMSAQEAREKGELEKFQTFVASLHSAQDGLIAQTAAIESQRQALEDKVQKLEQIRQQLVETEARLGRKQEAIRQGILELKAQRELLQEDIQKLQELRQKMQENEAASAQRVRDLDGQSLLKLKQIADLNSQIAQKNAQLYRS